MDLKVKTVEYLDSRIVKPIVDEISKWDEPVTLAILPDHPTPCAIKTHTRDAVPFIIWGPGVEKDAVETYDEASVKKGRYGTLKKDEFIRLLFSFE